jgi:thiol:disulfide interchange protein DsbA
MKRIAIMAVGLTFAVLLGACNKSNPPPVTPTSAAASAESASSIAMVAASSSISSGAIEPAPEQVTETATATASSVSSNSALALKISTPPAPVASRWQEGVNYTLLAPAQPTSAAPGQVEVTEVFWYGCPHCNALDPYLETWRKSKPAYVSFVRLPVMWGPVHKMHARLFYAAELLGNIDSLHPAIFREIHSNNDPLTTAEQIEKFFSANGVAPADFQKAFSSFSMEASLKRAETLGLRYKVESVPLLIINGKYVTDVGKAGGQQQLISLINELAAREHGSGV